MLHSHNSSDQEAEAELQTTYVPEPEQTMDQKLDPQIENFLDRIFEPSWARTPYEERTALRGDLRRRIEAAAAANMEMGYIRSEALVLSMDQIRREEAISERTGRQTVQTRSRALASAKPATITALGFFGLFYLLDQTRAAGHLWETLGFGALYQGGKVLQHSTTVEAFYRFELFVLPMICGLAVGLLARHRPIRGTLNALALMAIPAIVWGGLMYGLGFSGILPQPPDWMRFVFPNPIPAVCGIGAWAALGTLAAGGGGWLRRRLPQVGIALRRLGKVGRYARQAIGKGVRSRRRPKIRRIGTEIIR